MEAKFFKDTFIFFWLRHMACEHLKFTNRDGTRALQEVQVLGAQSCPTLCDPTDCSPPGSSVHWDFPDKNTGVGCHFLFYVWTITNCGKLLERWEYQTILPVS